MASLRNRHLPFWEATWKEKEMHPSQRKVLPPTGAFSGFKQALRSGVLNAPTNELGSAMEAANLFYVGTFFTFYDMWLGGNKTMLQSGGPTVQLLQKLQNNTCMQGHEAHIYRY
eukprot:1159404-Pelagomonas_calceolata.AAC.3